MYTKRFTLPLPAARTINNSNERSSKWHQKTGVKHFIFSQKLDCLAQHPKKPLSQNGTSRWKKSIVNQPGFHLYFLCLLLLVLAFRTNKQPKRAMWCSNGNIYKRQNEQPKAFACVGFWDRTDSIWKARMSNEKQQRATKDHNEHHGWKTKPDNKKP